MKFDKVFKNIISEIKIFSGSNALYKINDDAFKPIIYKDVCICASSLNKKFDHILERLKYRSPYSFNDLIIIVKRAIDKILSLNKIPDNQAFTVYSQSYPEIKVNIIFESNKARDIFSSDYNNCRYYCFIYTLLTKDMIEYSRDKKLIVEHNSNIIVN